LIANTAQHRSRRTGTTRRSQEAHNYYSVGVSVARRPRRHGNERRLAAAGLAVQHEWSARGLGGGGVVVHVNGNSVQQVRATDESTTLVYQSGSVLSVGCKNLRLLVEVIKQFDNAYILLKWLLIYYYILNNH